MVINPKKVHKHRRRPQGWGWEGVLLALLVYFSTFDLFLVDFSATYLLHLVVISSRSEPAENHNFLPIFHSL
jgi:hypothetical protein